MANDHKLLSRCVAKLDSMSHGSTELRPKSLEKLKNTLKRESEVIYVNQILICLLTMDKEVPLMNEEVVHKTDSELDTAISETVFKQAQQERRHFFVLPCDSDLHNEIESNINEWYSQKDRIVDMDNPTLGIAKASSINSHLDVDKIIRHLEHLDIIHQWLNLVSYKFPDDVALEELAKAWDKWITMIQSDLGKVSARTYHLFSTVIKEANDAIQDAKVQEIGEYCDELFVSKYPKYKSHQKNTAVGAVTEKMETNLDDCETSNHKEIPVDNEDRKQTLLNSPLFLWPVAMEPEVVHVILKLWEEKKRPDTMHQFKAFVKSVGHLTYVASPKYALMSRIPANETVADGDDDVTLNVRLGSATTKKMFKLNNSSALGSVLRFPGKRKPSKGKSLAGCRKMFDRLDTSSDVAKETLQGFQEHILKTAKHLSQRSGAVLLFDDVDANERCRDNLQKYLTSLEDSNGVRGDEFSKQMLKLSCEMTTVPVENLINLLSNAGYLQINEVDMSVTYTTAYRKNKFMDKTPVEATFLREWQRFYKQTEEPSNIEKDMYTSARKRKFQGLFTSFHTPYINKRRRVIDI